MSAPDFEVLAYQVPVAWTMTVTSATQDDANQDEEYLAVVVLDFTERPQAAALMMEWTVPDAAPRDLRMHCGVWLPLLGEQPAGCEPGGPVVEFTLAPAQQPVGPGPAQALAFRINVQDRGAFMRLATATDAIGITALPPADWVDSDDTFGPPIVTGTHDPEHLLWVELLAWRQALAREEPRAYQPEIPWS